MNEQMYNTIELIVILVILFGGSYILIKWVKGELGIKELEFKEEKK